MIKYLVMDVDGTLTDGKIYIGKDGEMMKAFNVKDGYGIHTLLPLYEINPIVMTGRNSRILEERCKELGINILLQNIKDKDKVLKELLHGDLHEVAYIGDDINDLEAMLSIKMSGGKLGCPSDAVKEIQVNVDFISKYEGGNGSVREFIEWIISNNRFI